MRNNLLIIIYFLALATARIPTDPPQIIESVTSVVPSSRSTKNNGSLVLLQKPSKNTDPDQIQLDLCDCQPATGEPGGLSCDKEGFFIAAFERQGSWVAGGGAVPLSRAICCRPCLPDDLPDDSPIFKDGDRPLALVSMGCHASTDPLGVRCEADNTANTQCCTPALLMESGDAWELERCDCGVSTDPEHSVSCSIPSSDSGGGGGGGGGGEKNSSSSPDIPTGTILSGFDFFRISPLGQIVPIGPAKCCGVCLSEKVHPAADCRDLNHCSGAGVCLLGRCECLQGWGSSDCSQSLAGKGSKIPPWAISLIVIGSCLLTMIVLSAAAHVAELIFEARSRRATESNDGDGDDARRPLLLRIDADDAGSVGSQDTEGAECDDEDVLLGGVEERIEQVIHHLEERRGSEEEAAAADARGGGTGTDEDDEEGEEVISDGEASDIEEERREEEEQLMREDVAGSSVPSSSSGRRGRLSTPHLQGVTTTTTAEPTSIEASRGQADASVSEREGERTVEEVNSSRENNEPEKPAAASLQSYMGIGPLSGVDCVVCMIRPVQTVVIPCGHVCMCRRCSRRLNRCPVCRKDVVRRQRLFV